MAAVNIPAYDIGTIDTELDITFPGSDYAGEMGDMGLSHSVTLLHDIT